jgi:hypothetical protein
MPALCAALLAQPAPAAPPGQLRGELVLDATDPVIGATLDNQRIRLRVDLSQNDMIEVSIALAARLFGAFEPGNDIQVGRTLLRGRVAPADLRLGGKPIPVTVAVHDGTDIGTADAVIGPEQLPYRVVRWRRADAPPATGRLALPIEVSDATRLSAAAPELPGVRLRFAPAEATSATAAAGVSLARVWGGSVAPERIRIPLLFGIERPGRLMRFARPGTLASFPIAALPIRTFDFGGDTPSLLPRPTVAADEVLVSHPLPRQREWRAVTIGGDLLRRCAEIAYDRVTRMLTLSCAFAGPVE